MIPRALPPQERRRDGGGKTLGRDNGEPYAVQTEHGRKEEDQTAAQQQRTQEGDEGAQRAVAQRGEERRRIDVYAAEQIAQREQAEAVHGELHQVGGVADEGRAQRTAERFAQHDHRARGDEYKEHAPSKYIFQLIVVLCAEMIADDGRAADGETEKRRDKDEIDVHHDRVRRNAALTDQPHQLEVIQDADEGRGDVAHQLGRAVAAGLQKLTDIQLCAGEVQAGAVRDEEYERDDAADAVAGDRRPRRARQAEELNEHPVAGEIGHARGDGQDKTHVRLFRDNEKRLERGLEHEREAAGEQNTAVGHAGVHQNIARTGEPGDGFDERRTGHAQNAAEKDDGKDEHREKAVRHVGTALAERARDDCAAAGAEHEADRRDQHRDREHDVDRAQTDVSDHVGHKKSVRDAVQRGQDHHGDARERKTKQTAEGKVV